MDHLQKAHDFINQITEVITQYQWEFNTLDVRLKICHDLELLFNLGFDEYWQKSTGIHPSDLKFVDLTTNEIVNQNQYAIGICIKGSEPIPFSDFITEYFGRESVRDRMIKEVLG